MERRPPSRSPLAPSSHQRTVAAARKRAPRHPPAPEARLRQAVAAVLLPVHRALIAAAKRTRPARAARHDAAGLYADILPALLALPGARAIGQTSAGPILVAELPGAPVVVVVTGQHGEEQAGPLLFAEHGEAIFAAARRLGAGLRVYPCVNPEGFDRRSRRDRSGNVHANSFMEYLVAGRWAGELAPGDVPEATRRPHQQAPETRALYDDLVPFVEAHRPVALLDLHQDSLLHRDDVFAYASTRKREIAALLARAGAPYVERQLENGSWSDLPAATDGRGISDIRDGSVSDWADRQGLLALATETSVVDLAAAVAVDHRLVRGLVEHVAGVRLDADPPAKGSVFAPLWSDALARLHGDTFKRIVRESAAATARSAAEQTADALDIDPDDATPDDVQDLVDAFAGKGDGAVEDFLAESFQRAEDILDGWDGEDPDDLEAELADGMDGLMGSAMAWVAMAAAALFADAIRSSQEEAGVNRYVWLTNKDSHVRPAHRALDGEECRWDDPPLKAEDASCGEDCHAGEDYNCVVGETLVSFDAPAVKAYRRWYAGPTVDLAVAGVTVRVTPNHPVLTRRGMLAAHLVEVGDHLVEAPAQGVEVGIANPQRREAMAEQVFRARAIAGDVVKRVAGRAPWFHGDGSDEDVDVVAIDGGLLLDDMPEGAKGCGHDRLSLASSLGLRLRHLASRLVAMVRAAHGFMCSGGKRASLLGSGLRHAKEHGRAAPPSLDPVLAQDASDGQTALAKPHALSDLQLAHAVAVELHDLVLGKSEGAIVTDGDGLAKEPGVRGLHVDAGSLGDDALARAILVHPQEFVFHRVEAIRTAKHEGWVYNFETVSGWFLAHGLIVANCRCVASPIPPDEDESMSGVAPGDRD